MKRIYLSIVLGGLCFGSATAQYNQTSGATQQFATKVKGEPTAVGVAKAGVEIWSNNFDTPADWTIDNDGETDAGFGWDIGTTEDSWFFTSAISSGSGGNFAEVGNGNPTATPGTQKIGKTYTLTLANSINVLGLPGNISGDDVTLQFEQYGARFYDEQAVQVSTDGTNWTTVFTNNDKTINSTTSDGVYANPTTEIVNLAPYIDGGGAAVWIRFTWTSQFPADTDPNAWVAYGWMIDDVKLFTNPENDLALWSSYVVGENNGGSEYGRTPIDQVDANWTIGGQVYNNGTATQNNLSLTADFTSFTANATLASLNSGDTSLVETTDPVTLAVGTYTGNYTIVSDEETAGDEFANNTGSRKFEITPANAENNSIYSLDGVGVYDSPVTSSLGSGSFTGNEDGLVLATRYHIKQTTPVSGVRVMLAQGTQAGAEVYARMIDTAAFWAGNVTGFLNATAGGTVAANHLSNGYIDLMFPAGSSLDAGAYFAAVELLSNGGTNHVYVVDDETVGQPSDASAIYVPNGAQTGPFGNGNALGIRLLMGQSWLGLNENTLTGVSVFPNPSEGLVTVSNDNGTSNTIEVYDMLGNAILSHTTSTSTTLDLTSVDAGIYMVRVSNESGSLVENVVIK